MLNDEEREAIEWVKNNLEETIKLGQKYGLQEAIKEQTIILNLIEKQSKEIEELKNGQIDFWISDKEIEERIRNKFVSKEESEQKERKAYIKGTNDADELCNKKWEDKIKAKIEELEKEYKEAYNKGFKTDMVNRLREIKLMQSLIEKE